VFHEYVNGAVPPVIVTVAYPETLQVGFVELTLTVIAPFDPGIYTVAVAVLGIHIASLTVTEYVPGHKLYTAEVVAPLVH
jgi:hypothetical protein